VQAVPTSGPSTEAAEIAALREALERSEAQVRALRSDTQHRIRNLLSVVRSISARPIERAASLEDLELHQSGRINALARVEDMLLRGDNSADLEEIIDEELLVVLGGQGDDRRSLEGPPVRLTVKAAERLALAFHELTTNALKFGALSREDGRVSVEWRIAGDRFHLTWRESGLPVMNRSPSRRGFGRDLIETALPYDLGAQTRLSFAPGGIICEIELPLTGLLIVSASDVPGLEMRS
jgi:two-component sensor histidine kinase